MAPHRFIERFMDMTKTVTPPAAAPYVRNLADTVTYAIVLGMFVLAIIAFIFMK
jgi:hypothetical protein